MPQDNTSPPSAKQPGDSIETNPGEAVDSKAEAAKKRRDMPTNLWMQCEGCSKLVYKPSVEEKQHVCPECNFHFEISSAQRIQVLLDTGSFDELFTNLSPLDPLGFRALKAYKDRLVETQRRTGLKDACVVGTGRIERMPVVFGVSDSRFLRGSMGSVVGEKFARATQDAILRRRPLIVVSRSGGARMQESIYSLMQMAKTSAMLDRLSSEALPYISILTNPTTGGVTASFAMLGDVIIAEPRALIGFAGPRVIQQTIRQDLPEGFQRSEFLLEHGMIDLIVPRDELRRTLEGLLDFMCARAVSASEQDVKDGSQSPAVS